MIMGDNWVLLLHGVDFCSNPHDTISLLVKKSTLAPPLVFSMDFFFFLGRFYSMEIQFSEALVYLKEGICF